MFSSGQTISIHQNLQIKANQNLIYQFGNPLQQWKKRQTWSFQIWLFCDKMFCISTYLTLHKNSVQIQLSEKMI